MKLIGLVFIISTLSFAKCEDSEVTKFMKYLEVVPDVISQGPKDFLRVSFKSGVVADKGVELKPKQVKDQPNVDWNADKNAYYTLIMTDPDAPSKSAPKFREWHHWLVGNIPENDVSKGEILSEYIGSAPPKNTGLHRYVILLFKQPKKLDFDEPKLKKDSYENREKFSTQKFAAKYNLGVPIAGNFFQAQHEDS